jgi:hypothetical protein
VGLFVAGELASRWWIRRRGDYFVFPPGLRMRLEPDPDVYPELERAVRFDVNADGERGNEVPHVESLFRILVAGGSQPEGYLLDQDTTWPGALQRLLQAPACLQRLGAAHVHVGSIARSGVGSEGLDLILSRVLPRYPRLQLIIVLVGATDVLRWLEYGAADVLPQVRVPDVFRCHPEGPFGWRPSQLAALELLRRARQRWMRPVMANERAGKWMGKARTMRAQAKVVRTALPDPIPMLRRFDLHFTRLVQRAKAHADRVLVVPQPWFSRSFTPAEAAHMWHGGVGQCWREDLTTYYSFDVVSRLMALVAGRASALADEAGVEQLDLMPLLEQSLDTYYDGFHATPAGAREVATLVGTAVVHGCGRVQPAAESLPSAPEVSPVVLRAS